MNPLLTAIFFLAITIPVAGLSQEAGPVLTPAQQRIAAARLQLQADPNKPQAINELTLALIRRARETADPTYFTQAADTLAPALKHSPQDFALLRTQATLLLSQHQYAQAEEIAKALHKRTPDDVLTYGILAEAEMGLGDYDQAAKNAQWMMNLRPWNTPALLVAARIRAHDGNYAGAAQFLDRAYAQTSPTEVEELAWIANQIASVQIQAGSVAAARRALDLADRTFPKYPYTAENLARMQSAKPSQMSSVSAENAAPEPKIPPTPIAAVAPAPVALVAASFSPVPENLLTPLPTGTAHMLQSAQTAAAHSPNDAAAFAALGAAYFQRARETGDVSDYQSAEESLKKSLDLSTDDFSSESALETLAEVCMGEHRFTDALAYAQKALSLGTGELSPFAIAGDAYADMGDYDKAASAYSRLTPRDMTPSPRAAYARDSRLAFLKFVSGDTPAAIALMKTAVAEGVAAQLPSENLAWLNYELGEFETQAGDQAAADQAYLAALSIHPGDYRALAALGKLRANSGATAEAIQLYQKAIAVVPMPIFIAELGDLYAKSGNAAEAEKQFSLVEYIGLLGHINQVLHNRDLALFYADHDRKLPEALDLAQKELEVRRDVYTWDALAWALYKNGKLPEAAEASLKARKFNTQDALLFYHAGIIAAAQGLAEQARSDLQQALRINPHFHAIYATAAEHKLATLQTQSKEGQNQHGR